MSVIQDKIKVHVTLLDGSDFWAFAYVNKDYRLQDLVNDNRTFIPFEKFMEERSNKNDTYKCIIVNKSAIAAIEER